MSAVVWLDKILSDGRAYAEALDREIEGATLMNDEPLRLCAFRVESPFIAFDGGFEVTDLLAVGYGFAWLKLAFARQNDEGRWVFLIEPIYPDDRVT